MNLEIHIKKQLGNFCLDTQLESDENRIGILGASGCGKSMTLKSIAGIETPDEGYIRIGDRVLFDSKNKINLKPQERNIGYLFQNYALFPTMTVLKNIEAGLKGTKAQNRARALQMIDKFELQGLEEHLPGQLSGGQQQRVALARIMAYEPDVILLDEPFSALDVFLKDKLQQELLRMLEDYKGTVILVSHSRDEIYNYGKSLLVMDQGQSVIFGDTKEIFKRPTYAKAAILTGCKNLTGAKKMGTNRIYCPEWDLELVTEENVPDDVAFVGVRAHDFEPLWLNSGMDSVGNVSDASGDENTFPLVIASTAELPFEMHYYVQRNEQEIAWYTQREEQKKFEELGIPTHLRIPKESLLLLK